MAASSFPQVLARLRNKCANCALFDWEQPGLDTLRQCAKCKVLQYCGQHCQKEHWLLVHKQDCKMLAFMKSYDCHAFPAMKAQDLEFFNMEFLKILMQKVIAKILSSDMSADSRVHDPLTQLWENINDGNEKTWVARRIWPKTNPYFSSTFGDLFDQTRVIIMTLTLQDFWSTLHLLWGRFIDFRHIALLKTLKSHNESLPKELWNGLQKEIGVFPDRVAELIEAFSGDEIPSFKDLLRIFCGGTLLQKCSTCQSSVTVAAVQGEVEGCFFSAVQVAIMPYMPPIFSCGDQRCSREMEVKVLALKKWEVGIVTTVNKLISYRCDYCFKMSEEVHRCSKCLTKHWCSRECQEKDWEEKHKEFCIEGADERKVRGGSRSRRKTGMKSSKEGLQKTMEANADKSVELLSMLSEVKELCQKKEKMVKTGTKVEASSNN